MSLQPLFNHLTELMANLILQLTFSRWARDYEAHHGACEDNYTARLGPLQLEVSECFVLDHRDASVGICLPIPFRQGRTVRWGKLHLGYMVCRGAEQIRPPGFCSYLQRPLPEPCPPTIPIIGPDDSLPF